MFLFLFLQRVVLGLRDWFLFLLELGERILVWLLLLGQWLWDWQRLWNGQRLWNWQRQRFGIR